MVAFFLNVTAFCLKRGHVLKKDGRLWKRILSEKGDKGLNVVAMYAHETLFKSGICEIDRACFYE